jgi:heme oxygenase (biliverdin-IX-beta and delta-forming)
MKKKIDPIRPTDDAARELARELIRANAHGALAVLDPETGYPLASRIALHHDDRFTPIFLASDLSFHSRALAVDPRASILLGEPGKGDPLAHPRITLIGRATIFDNRGGEHEAQRTRWLKRHPKSELYIDFADFHFYRLAVERAHLNGGFGKAYVLGTKDIAGGERA